MCRGLPRAQLGPRQLSFPARTPLALYQLARSPAPGLLSLWSAGTLFQVSQGQKGPGPGARNPGLLPQPRPSLPDLFPLV